MKYSVFGVVLMLNSATGTPLDATRGPNMAAGYTIEDVPTWRGTFLLKKFHVQHNFQSLANLAEVLQSRDVVPKPVPQF